MKVITHYNDDKQYDWENCRYDITLCGKSTLPIDSCVYHTKTSCRDKVTCESCKRILLERECSNYNGGCPAPGSSFGSTPIPFGILCSCPPTKTESCDEIIIETLRQYNRYKIVSNVVEKDGVVSFTEKGDSYEVKGEIVMKKNSRIV